MLNVVSLRAQSRKAIYEIKEVQPLNDFIPAGFVFHVDFLVIPWNWRELYLDWCNDV